MAKLTVAVDESKEAIGKGLLDALKALSGDSSIETFTGKLVTASETLGRYITNVAEFLSILNPNNTVKIGGKFVRKSDTFSGTPFGQSAESKAVKQAVTLRKTENAQIKAKTELEKLKDKYDVERIGLMAALNAATDEETRIRIAEKLAILDGNAAKAQQYLADTELTFQTNQLAKAINNAGLAADSFSKFAMGAVQRGEYSDAYKNISNVPSGGAGGYSPIPTPSFNMGANQRGEYAPVTVNVAGSVLTELDLTDTIQRTILQINKQGRGTTPAGGLSGGT
jgi:hypothetical protein